MDDAGHLPVLLEAVRELLGPSRLQVVVDATVGLGGHAEAFLSENANLALIGIDKDRENLIQAKVRLARFGGRVRLFEADFADVKEVLAEAQRTEADGFLADLGVASTHLDDPARGFSFQSDGPLDMRMSRQGKTAADLVNTLDERQLADLIFRYGEERFSRRIARAIVAARKSGPVLRTGQLAQIVESVVGRGGARIHPATRTFQALRIAVNGELESLRRLLQVLPSIMAVGGRAAIISFHSLEDRQVKQAFAEAVRGGGCRLLTPKPVTASEQEIEYNPRSRSAKLRAIERIR